MPEKYHKFNAENTNLNWYAIYDSVRAKNPIEDRCLSFDEFQEKFCIQAYDNENTVLDLIKQGKTTNWVKANKVKLGAKLWRPNAVYGNRPNGTSQDRVIMGSGLYSFDIDLDFYNFKEHQKKLEGYKEILMRDCINVFAVYKSFSMTGLHIILLGGSVKNNKSYRLEWDKLRRILKKDFKWVKIDEKAKDITRAMFIGSDSNPLFRYDIVDYAKNVKADTKEQMLSLKRFECSTWVNYALNNLIDDENEKYIERPSEVDIEFARVQCLFKPSFIDNTRKRYIRHRIDFDDLDEANKEKYSKVFSDFTKVKTGEEYQIDAYLFDCGNPIFLPRTKVVKNFIPVGRRRSTLTSLVSKFLYINGYWLVDSIPLVKTHFLKHYFEMFEKKKDAPFTVEEMNSCIDSVLKGYLLPQEIRHVNKDPKQNFRKKEILIDPNKSKLTANQSSVISRKYVNKKRKKENVIGACILIYALHGKDITIKQLYHLAKDIWAMYGITSESSLRNYAQTNDISLHYIHIINSISTSTNIYVENSKDITPPVPSKERGGNV